MVGYDFKTPDGETGTVKASSKAEASKKIKKKLGIKGRMPYGTKISRFKEKYKVKGPSTVKLPKKEIPMSSMDPDTPMKTPSDVQVVLHLSGHQAEKILDHILPDEELVPVAIDIVKQIRA